jgi:ESS family glutamate:Na+ symporter
MERVIYLFFYLSFLMLIGIIIRSKIKFLKDFFIPASLVGGIVGLILNPIFIPNEWVKEISLLPALLIVPVITSIPLGLKFKGFKDGGRDTLLMGAIMFMVTFLQLATGYSVNFIFNFFGWNLYKSFGAELNAAFAGGHGTAGLIGRTLQDMNLNYWNLAQGVTSTLATFGLLGGLFLGISIIYTKKKNIISFENKNEAQTSSVSTSNSFLFHLSLIFTVCGGAYLLVKFIKNHRIPILSSLSVWSIGMILMFLIWKGMEKFKLDSLIDNTVKTKITSFLTEFAILSAISTLPIKAVFSYLLPVIILTLLGFAVTWGSIRILTIFYFKENYTFEREVAILGTSLGVFLTGIVLLRICDPKFETPVLRDYSLGFSLVSLMGPIAIVSSISLSISRGAIAPILLNLACFGITFFISLLYRPQKQPVLIL